MTAPQIIAIDGTAASGKGTLARKLAADLGFAHLDTGKLYRYVGWAVMDAGGDPADEKAAIAAAKAMNFGFDPAALDNPALTTDAAGQAASKVAAMPVVRDLLFDYQRNFARNAAPGAILDGRDIGTVICPDAAVKFYVDADQEIRAQRRHKELQNRGLLVTYDAVLADMRERDARDMGRADAPLKPADDAVIIDTTHLNADEAFDKVRTLARQRLGIS